jgi:hypothetical protein
VLTTINIESMGALLGMMKAIVEVAVDNSDSSNMRRD